MHRQRSSEPSPARALWSCAVVTMEPSLPRRDGFAKPDGPRVLVLHRRRRREGINLQFARILFNFDLPMESDGCGATHRSDTSIRQNHTAQVYNLILSDTIEGRIFLLLDEKLREIARTLGKLDADGNAAEILEARSWASYQNG